MDYVEGRETIGTNLAYVDEFPVGGDGDVVGLEKGGGIRAVKTYWPGQKDKERGR